MSHTVTFIDGDTTGPEICEAIHPLFSAAGAEVTWERWSLDDNFEASEDLLASIREHGAALMAYTWGRRHEGKPAPIISLRRKLGCYANLRPLVHLPGIDSVYKDVDIIVVRELTEDIYAAMEHESIPNVFESFKVTTRSSCERIARYAFEVARINGRKKVTIAHKSNIMKLSDGMFLRTAQKVALEYPEIEAEECIVDALCMKLVLHPERYDVVLCGNLFGDIVGDLCTGLVGGPVNAPSINRAPDCVVFTPGHGDPPELVGTGTANPMPLLLSSLYLLEHLGENGARQRLGTAMEQAVADGVLPHDLGGAASCSEYVDAVARRL